MRFAILVAGGILLCPPMPARGQAPPRPLAGVVVLGGGAETGAVREVLRAAQARRPERRLLVLRPAGAAVPIPEAFTERGVAVRDARPVPGAESTPAELDAAIAAAGAVWLAAAGEEEWRAELAPDAPLAVALRRLVDSGGVVGTESTGKTGGAVARLLGVDGAGLVPDLLIASLDEDCSARSAAHPAAPVLRIGTHAAAVVAGRLIRAAEPASADAEERRAAARVSVSLPDAHAMHGEAPLGTSKIVDGLPRFDRLALVRAAGEAEHPAATTAAVPGTLLLAGGGALPDGYVARFLELAGGAEARLVVLGSRASGGSGAAAPDGPLVRALHASCASLATVRADPARPLLAEGELSDLRAATGVWIEGGRACDLVDAYLESDVPALLAGVLARGGVVAGASAGASIQADVLVRGGPFDNRDVLVAGYARGFALLAGCAVDQHLSERGRFPDLLALKRARPELLVLGIDERTALEVRGTVGTVTGRGAVWFLGGADAPDLPEGAATRASAGERYDLVRRRSLP
jgi:cyanophycinase